MHRCREIDCNIKYACFNLPGEKQGICCVSHKDDNMIDVINKKCKSEGCNIGPCYNYPKEKQGIYCFSHKLENMVDVTSKKMYF
jgi:hypothetical protein